MVIQPVLASDHEINNFIMPIIYKKEFMKFQAKHIYLVILGCFFCACSKTNKDVNPVVAVDPPVVSVAPNSTFDVRNLQIFPYLFNQRFEPTQYNSALSFDDWLAKPSPKPVFGEMVLKGEMVNLITVGGGVTAGAQSGGLFRDGQLSAYPNLVAKQMGISDFKSPLFDEAHANGTGFTLIKDPTSQTVFKVENSLGTVREQENGKPINFSPYTGTVNNYSAPWLSTWQIFDSIWDETMIGKVVNANGVSWLPFLPYVARFIPIDHFKSGTLFNYITDYHPYNFFILDINAEVFLNNIRLKGSRNVGLSDFIGDIQNGDNYTLKAIQKFKRNESNGAIFTVPHFRDLGISTWDVKVLNQEEVLMYENGVDITNKYLREWANSNGLAVVDLDVLYKDVKEGRVMIGERISVKGNFKGNFFSSDGIYPSTLGQAVIANEVIRAINLKFKSQIQPVDIEKYLVSIGFAY